MRPNVHSIPDTLADVSVGPRARKIDAGRFARTAAVVAAFALATLVIAAVFRGFDGDGGDEPDPAGGFLAGDVAAHPPQLAITMLPDPNDADPDIYLTSPDGAKQTNLTNNLAADSFPTWSPDGHKLAFVSNRAGPEAVYILDLTSGDLRELYAPGLEDNLHLRNLAWSPDGASIALMRVSKSSSNIGGTLSGVVVVDVASGAWHPVEIVADYPAPAYYALPTWSPDSRWLLFEAFGPQESRLFIVDTTPPADNPRLLSIVADIPGNSATWSSTGEIAIDDGSDIRIVRFDDERREFEELRRFTPDESKTVAGLAWSPDGSRLVFSLSSAGDSSLWIADGDGANLTEIPDAVTGVSPAWSTDGAQIAFLRADTFIYTPVAVAHTLVIYDVASDSIVAESPIVSPPEPLAGPFAWRPGEILPEDDESTAEPTPTEASAESTAPPTLPPTESEAASPELHIEPGSRFCSDTLSIEASGFPQDEPVTLSVRNLETDESHEVDTVPGANSAGEFTIELPIDLMYPECETEATRPGGLRLEISMATSGTGGNPIEAGVDIHVFIDSGRGSSASLDDPRVQQAIQQVRDFLGDLEAEFAALPIEESGEFVYVTLEQRDPDGPIPGGVFNTFVVELNQDALFVANLAMNSTIAQPSNPITVDQARDVAETFYSQHDTLGESLTVVEERSDVYLFGDEERYDITWQLESEGVRLPTMVAVRVSLKTGLVVNYLRYHVRYDGPLTPEVPEEEARQTAEQIIAEDPEFAGATVGETRLEVWYSGPDDSIAGVSAADPEMTWRLAWTFTLVDRPGPESDHLQLIDALTGQKLEPEV